MNEINDLLNVLGANHGWVPAAVAWIGAMRLALKPFASAIQSKVMLVLVRIAESKEQDDDAWLESKLCHRGYRALVIAADVLASIKLPTHEQFLKLKNP